jgi:hypothetical protein
MSDVIAFRRKSLAPRKIAITNNATKTPLAQPPSLPSEPRRSLEADLNSIVQRLESAIDHVVSVLGSVTYPQARSALELEIDCTRCQLNFVRRQLAVLRVALCEKDRSASLTTYDLEGLGGVH